MCDSFQKKTDGYKLEKIGEGSKRAVKEEKEEKEEEIVNHPASSDVKPVAIVTKRKRAVKEEEEKSASAVDIKQVRRIAKMPVKKTENVKDHKMEEHVEEKKKSRKGKAR